MTRAWWRRVWDAILARPLPSPIAAPAFAEERKGISQRTLWEASRHGTAVADATETFTSYKPMPGIIPAGMAMDDASNLPALPGQLSAVATWAAEQTYHEGLRFAGYQYLAELAQRPEYRKMAEKWAEHATRKWIKITGTKDRVDAIWKMLEALNARMIFREAFEHDGLFGRSQIFLDFGDADQDAETETPLLVDKRKVNAGRPLKRLKTVEPMWSYPATYVTRNPLSPDFYRPSSWFVYGRKVDGSRLLTLVGREVPDMLKPSYAFGGLSLTQMAKPYVDNWLRTRQSVSDLVDAFSTMVLATDMSQALTGSGAGPDIFDRTDLFNLFRSNRGTFVIDKNTEELTNVTTPLSGLDKLQSQAQEQMASVSSIPLVVLLGITPSGLNASSEGELRTFYADVKAYQEKVARQPLTTIITLIQLSIDGKVDPTIAFEFEDLWEMSDKDKADIRKSDAEADKTYIDAGVVDAEETRDRLRSDETSLYHGVALTGPAPEADEEDDDQDDEVNTLRKAA